MVIITGQVPTPAIGLDAFQECDTVGITRPIVKHNFLVKDVRDLADDDEEGLPHRPQRPARAGGGRHPEGRVVQQDRLYRYPDKVEMRSYNPVRKGHGGQIRKALQLLLAAKRPYIYTGGGVVLGNASAELRELVDLLGYPVHQHADGPGRLSRRATRKFLGMLGMHGTYRSQQRRCRTATCCWPWARASTTA